jgi:cytochrome c553
MNKILLGSVVALALLAGCSDEKKSSTQNSTETTKEVKQETVVNVETSKENTNVTSVEAPSEIKETLIQSAPEVAEKTNEVVKESVEAATELAKDITRPVVEEVAQKVEEVKEIVELIKEDATTKVAETVEAAENTTKDLKEESLAIVVPTEPAIDGKALFASCASCHGQNAEKEALGKSQVIAGWNKEKIVAALNGYKDGTYGGVMKNIMKGQVSTKTDTEIDALAEFISNL